MPLSYYLLNCTLFFSYDFQVLPPLYLPWRFTCVTPLDTRLSFNSRLLAYLSVSSHSGLSFRSISDSSYFCSEMAASGSLFRLFLMFDITEKASLNRSVDS
jgi:hypothetical protein